MLGITWTDVRATIPQPLQAHDSVFGDRSVTARLWYTPARLKPYLVELRLLVDGIQFERWTHEYLAPSGVSWATAAYTHARERSERWLTGAPLHSSRPGRGWKITTADTPY